MGPTTKTLAPSKHQQPIFSTREINSNIFLAPKSAIALGGLDTDTEKSYFIIERSDGENKPQRHYSVDIKAHYDRFRVYVYQTETIGEQTVAAPILPPESITPEQVRQQSTLKHFYELYTHNGKNYYHDDVHSLTAAGPFDQPEESVDWQVGTRILLFAGDKSRVTLAIDDLYLHQWLQAEGAATPAPVILNKSMRSQILIAPGEIQTLSQEKHTTSIDGETTSIATFYLLERLPGKKITSKNTFGE